jgi:hypothetical protein
MNVRLPVYEYSDFGGMLGEKIAAFGTNETGEADSSVNHEMNAIYSIYIQLRPFPHELAELSTELSKCGKSALIALNSDINIIFKDLIRIHVNSNPEALTPSYHVGSDSFLTHSTVIVNSRGGGRFMYKRVSNVISSGLYDYWRKRVHEERMRKTGVVALTLKGDSRI